MHCISRTPVHAVQILCSFRDNDDPAPHQRELRWYASCLHDWACGPDRKSVKTYVSWNVCELQVPVSHIPENFTSRLPYQERDPQKMQPLRHILELTDKYAMDILRQDIIADVERISHPLCVNGTQQICMSRLECKPCGEESLRRYWRGLHQLDDLYPEPATAIQLARACNVPHILPAAFYHLSRISLYDDWDEIRRSDDIPDCGQQSALWMHLSAQDFLCLFKGKQKLQRAARDVLCLSDCPVCYSLPCHRSGFVDQLREACKSSDDILRTARHYIDKADQGDGLCAACSLDI